MLYVYEFDMFHAEGFILAVPFDFEGGTQGEDYAEAAEMAADWLRGEISYRLMAGLDVPEATLGHDTVHEGGRVLLVAVDVSLDAVDTVTATEAAEMLQVTKGRVSQMLKTGQLMGYRKGHASFVTRSSVEARQAEAPRAGRPKKSIA